MRCSKRRRAIRFQSAYLAAAVAELGSLGVNWTRMDISSGFQIEQPELFIPWKVSETDLQKIFDGRLLVSSRMVISPRIAFSRGLSHQLGFHFNPQGGGVLIELEFFRTSYADLSGCIRVSAAVEQTFGQPTTTTPGSEGFPSHTWRLSNAEVVHFVYDRFGPEEHVRIKKR